MWFNTQKNDDGMEKSLLKGLTMWYLIWRTNKTFFSSAIHHCLPITVFVLLMGDGVFSHSREWMRRRIRKHWFARLKASDARLDAEFAWNWCEKFQNLKGWLGTSKKNLAHPYHPTWTRRLQTVQWRDKNTHFWLFAQNIHHKLLLGTLRSRQSLQKRYKFPLSSDISKFLFAVALKLVISKRSYLKNVFALAQPRCKTMKQTTPFNGSEKKKTFSFLSLTTAKLFKLNNPSRERNPWVNSGRKRRSRRRKVLPAFQCKFTW